MKAFAALCGALLLAGAGMARAQSDGNPPTPPPTQAPPPPPVKPPPPPEGGVQAPPADVPSGGQWIYTTQYGWVYAPDGSQYTAEGETPDDDLYEYVYTPAAGWLWVEASWGLYSFQGGAGLTHSFHGGGFGEPSGAPQAVGHGPGSSGFSGHGGGHEGGGGHWGGGGYEGGGGHEGGGFSGHGGGGGHGGGHH